MSGEADRLAAELRATLARLHAELGRSPAVDAESRRLLAEVSADIERVLGTPEPTPPVTPISTQASAPRSTSAPTPTPTPTSTSTSTSTSTPVAGPGTAAHEPRLEALAVRFEAQHPDLAGSLRQLVDLLGRAGI